LNSFDPEKAARVWQRVQAQNHPAPPPPIREDRTIPEMIRLAREAGICQLELEVFETNRRAMALYEKMGFRITGVKPDAIRMKDGSFVNEYMMVKKL
jgi:GNAT superfamily N-acetyltransferase